MSARAGRRSRTPTREPRGRRRRGDAARRSSRAQRALGLRRLRALAIVAFLYFLLPQLAGLEDTWNRIEDGDPAGSSLALVLRRSACPSAATSMLFRGVFVRGERADRLARELPDHDGRRWPPRGCSRPAAPAASRSRRGRCGARAWPRAIGRRPDDRLPRPDLRRLHGRAIVVCGFGLRLRASSPAPAPFAITVVPGDLRAASLIALVARRSRSCPTDLAAPAATAGRAAHGRARRASAQRLATCPAAAVGRHARRDRTTCARATRRCSARSPAGRFHIAVLWAASTRSATPPPLAVLVHGLLRRHARQPAAAAGRRRRRRGRHDRRLRRVRRRRRPARSSPCSPTARSRSGCRRSRARSPTSSCARRSTRWREERRSGRRRYDGAYYKVK